LVRERVLAVFLERRGFGLAALFSGALDFGWFRSFRRERRCTAAC
jgi:hypothetical protein